MTSTTQAAPYYAHNTMETVEEVDEEKEEEELSKPEVNMKTMKLNEAFEALEAMRRVNLEVEFAGMGDLDPLLMDQYCTECLREEKNQPRLNGTPWSLFGGGNKKKERPTSPCCFTCATPVCAKHSCQANGLHMCKEQCYPLLQKQDLRDKLASFEDGQDRQAFVGHMMDVYDRSVIMLQYACQFEDLNELADCLEGSSRKHTHYQLGGSSMGFMAGVTGVGAMAGPAAAAAKASVAAAMLTPAGPSLLMASLLFGGTACCATVGHELAIHKFYKSSEEQQRYHKLLGWQAVVHTIASVAGVRPPKNTPSTTTCTETAIVVYQGKPKNLFLQAIQKGSLSTTRTESLTEFSERSSLDEFAEEVWNDDEDCNACNSSKAKEEEEEEGTNATFISSGDSEEDETANEESKDTAPEEYANDASEEAATPLGATEEATIADSEEEFPEEEDEMAPLLAPPAKEEGEPSNESPDQEEPTNDKDAAVETVEEESKEEEKSLTSNSQTGGKHPLAFLLPLAPLLDDAALTIGKMFTDPTGGVRSSISRASTHAVKVTQYASLAVGALSALTVFFEAYNIDKGLKRLEAPCLHAEKVRNLHHDVLDLPDTEMIAQAMQEYLQQQPQQTPNTTTATANLEQ